MPCWIRHRGFLSPLRTFLKAGCTLHSSNNAAPDALGWTFQAGLQNWHIGDAGWVTGGDADLYRAEMPRALSEHLPYHLIFLERCVERRIFAREGFTTIIAAAGVCCWPIVLLCHGALALNSLNFLRRGSHWRFLSRCIFFLAIEMNFWQSVVLTYTVISWTALFAQWQ